MVHTIIGSSYRHHASDRQNLAASLTLPRVPSGNRTSHCQLYCTVDMRLLKTSFRSERLLLHSVRIQRCPAGATSRSRRRGPSASRVSCAIYSKSVIDVGGRDLSVSDDTNRGHPRLLLLLLLDVQNRQGTAPPSSSIF